MTQASKASTAGLEASPRSDVVNQQVQFEVHE